MIHFIFILVFKIIEGSKNGAYYDRNKIERNVYIVWLFLISVVYMLNYTNIMLLIPLLMILIWQYWIFENDKGKQIHLSENVLSTYMRLFMVLSGASIPMMILTTGLQMVAFKIPINYYIGRDLINRVDGTNDDSGKTYNVWIGKYELHIPRISNGYTQLYLGILGLVVWLVLSYYGLDFTLETILK